MSKKKERLKNTVSEALGEKEEELYLLRWEKRGSEWVLEVLIDKDDPVTTDDCADASRQISSGLDDAGLIDRKYELQVSSPGLERPLIETRHFEGAVDSTVEIRTYGKIRGTKKLTGILREYDGEREELQLEYEGEELTIPMNSVAKATTKIKDEEVD